MTENEEQKIKKDYKKGLKYKEICDKYSITQNQLKTIIRKYKLTRTKSNAQKGNQNAKGNKGGHALPKNKNAVTTGEYENFLNDVLEEDEKNILNSSEIKREKDLLLDEYKVLHIREKRMLKRIKRLADGKEMTVKSIRDTNKKHYATTTDREIVTELEARDELIQRIEEGITRVQEAKRRCIETINKLIIQDDEDEEIDNSFIDALSGKVEDIWNEEE